MLRRIALPCLIVRGHTYCFQVRGTDTLGNVGAWSAKRCATVSRA
jgi:hypothetical protein